MNRTTAKKKDPKPKWKTVTVSLLEEDVELLEKSARRASRECSAQAGIVLANAIRAIGRKFGDTTREATL